MIHNRVRIVDVADALGLSTATVSKVIHGNTEKISDETVKRVQQELERTGYIPNSSYRKIHRRMPLMPVADTSVVGIEG